ncbi:MAG: extracellular solute-binding protein [Azospirillaceae bacterium]|nr:extracellular solute-binding protein [Azospirillaceae bacterium]
MQRWLAVALAVAALSGAAETTRAEAPSPPTTHAGAIAEFGQPLYGPDLDHWPYADPAAPKGGSIVLDAFGSFDSLNPIILRGRLPEGLGLTEDSLMVGSGDELSAAYGLIASEVEYPADKSWIRFTLRPEARWQDGVPITADDFVFAFETIRRVGRPFLQSFLHDITQVVAEDPQHLKVTVATRDRMKSLMQAAGLSPLPRHWWQSGGRDISKTTLEPVLDSGPYRIKAVDPGRSITYERVTDYWARDLPVNRGLNNIDTIRYDYYLDDTVAFEAFKAGKVDFRQENRAQRWVTGYDLPEARDGRLVRRSVADEMPGGTQGLIFNVRRPQFQDVRVREALSDLFDFEAIQRTLLYGQYKRIASWFPNSDFGASGPPDPQERAILEPFRDRVRPEVLSQAWEPPHSDGSGSNRENVRRALQLLQDAGWVLQDRRLVNAQSGQPFTLEVLLDAPEMVRLTEPFVQVLQRVGIEASVRVVDTAQYQERTDAFDFDLTAVRFNFFPPPGAEQRSYFGSAAADQRGSANFAGIKDPVVDALIEELIRAPDLDTLKATNRALDRVLLWGYYEIPQWYKDVDWLAYWNKFGYPARKPKYSVGFPGTWWVLPGKSG